MAGRFDLDAYFERIGFTGRAAPDLETLTILQWRHPQAIPFENLDPLLGVPVKLDVDALQRKLIKDGRGGWCYEQNLLFQHALEAIGFRVTGLAGRVFMDRPADAVPPRTHMMLRVDLDDVSYIVDAGFGGMTLTGPIRLEADAVQQTPHERRRLLQRDDEYEMQAEIRGEWRTLYRLSLAEQRLPDYELFNWYLCNHPDSHFLKTLMVARPTDTARFALRNNELAEHRRNGETRRTVLDSASELREALEDVFLIRLPQSRKLVALLERVSMGVLPAAASPAGTSPAEKEVDDIA